MAAKPMGRPPKKASKRQSRYVTIGLTAAQYRTLKKHAGRGVKVATWATVALQAIADGYSGKKLLNEIRKRLEK